MRVVSKVAMCGLEVRGKTRRKQSHWGMCKILTPFLMGVLPPAPKHTHTHPYLARPAGCATIHLSSDTTYLEIASDPTGEGLSPYKTAPQPPSDANCKSRFSPVLLTH